MASNPVAAKRTRRRPKPGLRTSLRRHCRSEPTCQRKNCNQSFSKGQKRTQQDDCRNQQYSIVALTNSAAGIVERYAYSAYGEPVFATGAGVVLTESAKENRYTYTGREWDEGLGLYHFRARMYDAESGRFCGLDALGYSDGLNLYGINISLHGQDPTGNYCRMERHHWFPRKPVTLRNEMESRCADINFDVDYFTTRLLACPDHKQDCDQHGYLEYRRQPKWKQTVRDILDGTTDCCQFLIAMAIEIAITMEDVQHRFNETTCPEMKHHNVCNKGFNYECYDPPTGSQFLPWTDTTRLLADIVESCRGDGNPGGDKKIVVIPLDLNSGVPSLQPCAGPESLFPAGVGAKSLLNILKSIFRRQIQNVPEKVPEVPKRIAA